MKIFSTIVLLVTLFTYNLSAQTATTIVPNSNTSGATFSGPLATTVARTYQWLINSSELTALVGKQITGIAVRLSSGASSTWPSAVTTYPNYDIYISQGVAPANRNLVAFANNVVGAQTLVRSGSLVIQPGDYPTGGVFGPTINFVTNYNYTGGHLLIELRHDIATGSANSSTDALAATNSGAGYGTLVSCCYNSNYNASGTPINGNFSNIQLTYTNPLPIKLTSFTGQTKENNVVLNWSEATSTSGERFEIQRSSDGKNFMTTGIVYNSESSTQETHFSYTDKNVQTNNPYIFYRLRLIESSGAESYSSTIKINIETEKTIVAVSPNPVENLAQITVDSKYKIDLSLTVSDETGKTLQQLKCNLESGSNNIPLNMAGYPSGVYFLSLKNNFIDEQIKILKK